MSKKWFDTVFLPSLFKYAGIGCSKRISDKQFDVFSMQYGVECNQCTTAGYYGTHYVIATKYMYNWNGRLVTVMTNGYKNTIKFGRTDEEQTEWLFKNECEKDKKDMEYYQRLKKRHPEKYSKVLEKQSEKFYIMIMILDASAASDNDSDFQDEFEDFERIKKEFYKIYFA